MVPISQIETCLDSPSRAETPAEPESGRLLEQQPVWSTRERQCAAQRSAPETPLISPGIINPMEKKKKMSVLLSYGQQDPSKKCTKAGGFFQGTTDAFLNVIYF